MHRLLLEERDQEEIGRRGPSTGKCFLTLQGKYPQAGAFLSGSSTVSLKTLQWAQSKFPESQRGPGAQRQGARVEARPALGDPPGADKVREHVLTHMRGPHCYHRCDRAGWTAEGFEGWKQGGGSPLALHLVNNGAFMLRASFQSHMTNINKGLLVMLPDEPHGPQTQDSISAHITRPE